MLTLDGLTETELEEVCRLPRKVMKEIFGKAEAWLKWNKKRLAQKHPGAYVLVNAQDLEYVVGINFDNAAAHYTKMHGPAPKEGRHFVGQVF